MKTCLICVPSDQDLQQKIINKVNQGAVDKNGRFLLVHVFKQENYPYMMPPYIYPNETQKAEVKKFFENLMQEMAKKMNLDQAECHCLFHETPKKGMIDMIKQKSPDLVVAATRGKHGIEGLFSSSFTEYLMKWAPSDLMVLH